MRILRWNTSSWDENTQQSEFFSGRCIWVEILKNRKFWYLNAYWLVSVKKINIDPLSISFRMTQLQNTIWMQIFAFGFDFQIRWAPSNLQPPRSVTSHNTDLGVWQPTPRLKHCLTLPHRAKMPWVALNSTPRGVEIAYGKVNWVGFWSTPNFASGTWTIDFAAYEQHTVALLLKKNTILSHNN